MSSSPADQNLIKRLNSALILDHLLVAAPQSRARLAQQTGLNRSTISSLVNALIQQGLIREVGVQEGATRGRPGILLELNPRGGCIVGIQINIDFISAILTDFTAHTLWRRYVNIDTHMQQAEILALAEEMVEAALRIGAAHSLRVLGIGLGLPGLVDTERGVLMYAPNFGWRNVPFCQMWGDRFGVPLYIENDGNASALGEYYFGVAKGCANFIYLCPSVGLAGGLMLNGQLYRGAGGHAGEVGHIVIKPDGDLCGCGRRGCWETLVAPHRVIQVVRQALECGTSSLISELSGGEPARITLPLIVDAARRGDALARHVLTDTGHYLGVGIANLVNLLNPELVVLDGQLVVAADYLLPVITETLAKEALAEPARMVSLALSSQGADACLKGAVALVVDRIVREPRTI